MRVLFVMIYSLLMKLSAISAEHWIFLAIQTNVCHYWMVCRFQTCADHEDDCSRLNCLSDLHDKTYCTCSVCICCWYRKCRCRNRFSWNNHILHVKCYNHCMSIMATIFIDSQIFSYLSMFDVVDNDQQWCSPLVPLPMATSNKVLLTRQYTFGIWKFQVEAYVPHILFGILLKLDRSVYILQLLLFLLKLEAEFLERDLQSIVLFSQQV